MAFTTRNKGILARVGGELVNLGLRNRAALEDTADDAAGFGLAVEQLLVTEIHVGNTLADGAILRFLDSSAAAILTLEDDGTATFAGDVFFEGSVTFNGANHIVEGTTVTYEDTVLLLGKDVTGAPTLDAGLIVERGDSDNVAMFWDESADAFALATTSDTGTDGSIAITAYADLHIASLRASGSIRLAEIAAPSNVADTGFIYVKDVGGVTELFYMDDSGDEVQVTDAGAVNAGAVASSLDASYNVGSTITVDAGPILANLAYHASGFTAYSAAVGTAANDLANAWRGFYFSLGNDTYTGGGSAIRVDLSGAAGLDSASDFYGLNLTGITNADASGVSIGVMLDGWDVGLLAGDSVPLSLGTGRDFSMLFDGGDTRFTAAAGSIFFKLPVNNTTEYHVFANSDDTPLLAIRADGRIIPNGGATIAPSSGNLTILGGMGGGVLDLGSNNTAQVRVSGGSVSPSADDDIDLGSSSARYKSISVRKIVKTIVSGNSASSPPSSAGQLCFVASDGLQLADAAAFSTSSIVDGPYAGAAGRVYGLDSEPISLPKRATNVGGTTYESMAQGDLVYLAAAIADEYDAGVTPAKGTVSLETPVSAGTVNHLVGRVVAASNASTSSVSVALRMQYLGTN